MILEMANMDGAIGRGFFHEGWFLRDAEGQVLRFFPSKNGLARNTGGERSLPIRAQSRPSRGRLHRIGHTQAKNPVRLFFNFREGHDSLPNNLWRGRDLDGTMHDMLRNGRRLPGFCADKEWKSQ